MTPSAPTDTSTTAADAAAAATPAGESPRPVKRSAAYRPFEAELTTRTQLSPGFVRLTFTGAELDQFGGTCLDQRIKLVLAGADQIETALSRGDDWYGWWLAEPDETRPVMRTYTTRAVRPDSHEVDLDFAVHGTEGPASAFAQDAELGSRVLLVGPDAGVPGSESAGMAWRPGEAREVVLIGDETAAPAICGIVETLADDVTGTVLIEVPTIEDALQLRAPAGVTVSWLARGDRPHGESLLRAVTDWAEQAVTSAGAGAADDPAAAAGEDARVEKNATVGEDETLWEEADADTARYVWVAAEAGVVAGIRRHLVRERGLDRHACSFMGYWKLGRQG